MFGGIQHHGRLLIQSPCMHGSSLVPRAPLGKPPLVTQTRAAEKSPSVFGQALSCFDEPVPHLIA